MYLKSIEINGFKSFAKKSELFFSSPISAIVGPNGSGKSNVAEAFRFVLGEQSIKSLRGKKGEDLIWNGAGDLARAGRASVKLFFDNSQKIFPMDFETVSIERVVHRDGVNEYLINGSQVRLKDVIELLASAHIGSSGHHIISQGEADRILSASIKERKTMIEDALGLRLYQYKKQESEKKLAKTRENIEKVESLRREIMPHLRFLKKQVEKVERAVQMKEELREKASEYLKKENQYINKKEEIISGKKGPLQEKEKKLNLELEEAKKILENTSHKDKTSEDLIELEKKLHEVRKNKDELLQKSGQLDGEIISLSKMVKKQEEIANSYLHKTITLISLESVQKEIEEKIKRAKDLQSISDIFKEIDEISKLLSNFIDDNKEKVDTSLLADAQKELSDLRQNKLEIAEKLKDATKEEERCTGEYSNLQEKINKEKDSNRDAEKTVFKIIAEEEFLRGEIRQLQTEEENLRIVKDDFKRELTELGMMLGSSILNSLNEKNLEENENEPRSLQEDRRRIIEKIKIRLEEAGGIGGGDIMKEFGEVSERDTFLEKELLDLRKSAESLENLIKDLDDKLSVEFSNGIDKINHQFREYFSIMFGGGTAELKTVKPEKKKNRDILLQSEDFDSLSVQSDLLESYDDTTDDSGIDIDVNLPKKKIKGLMMLSGGERALTSIALIFAISQVNPPPFIILDETDAALDEANSKKYGDMVENLSRKSQLIVITHNRETMSRAGILYGITMGASGGSKILSVAFEDALTVAK